MTRNTCSSAPIKSSRVILILIHAAAAAGLIACQWPRRWALTVIGTSFGRKAALAKGARLRPFDRLHAAKFFTAVKEIPAALFCRWCTTIAKHLRRVSGCCARRW